MAFQFDSGTATDVADWFTIFEAFLLTAGWTVEAGSGTQQITFRSIGEATGRAKLYIRFRQDGVAGEEVWYRVQDDLGGTHSTTEHSLTDHLDAGGGGAAAFEYWMAANRDYVTVTFLTGATYTGCYVGIVETFALSVPDEEYEMLAYALHKTDATSDGRVLRADDGTWDDMTQHRELVSSYDEHPLDNSYCIFSSYVDQNVHNRIVGALIGVSGRMNVVPGLNAQDTIATGIGGATSWWTVLGSGTVRWAMFCGGTLPTYDWETGFAHVQGTANTIDLLQAALDAFLLGRGWTITPNGGGWPIDQYYRSTGQLGTEDIWLHWEYDTVDRYWRGQIYDPTLTHWITAWCSIGDPRLEPADFPVNYHFGGDKDCFYICVEIAGAWNWGWFGLYKPLWADFASYATEYKVGQIQGPVGTGMAEYILRAPDGNWNRALTEWHDWTHDSSPQLMDGVTYMVWPHPLSYLSSPVGIPKYIRRVHGAPLAVNDTVTVGAKVYTVTGTATVGHEDWCIRTT